ncbi:RNA-binding protein Musashi homolog Rbp6-like [Tachypleus tridentatus]|uniref:RNA-binding protein Musashi homolog Rbp6-like n=1 Tax=Tachypleus tridentatus TaxID=6853 RepID=UPI003FD4531D
METEREQSTSVSTKTLSHDPGKMFIGGLSWQTASEKLREYFNKYGDIREVMVMKDPCTRRSRGFGFVTFADPNSIDKVLANGPHELDGKKIDPKVAFPKQTHPKIATRTKKVFVGGLSAPTTLEDLRNYFEQYGLVEGGMLMFDKQTNRHRGFGFVTFENEDVVDKVCEIHFHEINKKMVECKKAQPKAMLVSNNVLRSRGAVPGAYDLVWPFGTLTESFPAYTYGHGGYSGYAGFNYPFTGFHGFSYFTAHSTATAEHPQTTYHVINSYETQGINSPSSPVNNCGWPATNSSGAIEIYNSSHDSGSVIPTPFVNGYHYE